MFLLEPKYFYHTTFNLGEEEIQDNSRSKV